jgi:hypothetical protein
MPEKSIQEITKELEKYFMVVVPYFKSNLSMRKLEKPGSELIAELEGELDYKIPEDLKTFFEWSLITYLYGLPNTIDEEEKAMCGFLQVDLIPIYSTILQDSENKGWWNNVKLVPFFYKYASKSEKTNFYYYDIEGEFNGTKGAIVYIEFKRERIENKNYISEVERKFIATSLHEWLVEYSKAIQDLSSKQAKAKLSEKIKKLLKNPEKLHKFVEDYNWDDGEEILEQIIRDPRCDKATALMVYWRSQPYLYEPKDEYRDTILPFIIEENFQRDFYASSDNHFDPSNDRGTDYTEEYKNSNPLRDIPSFMQKKV